jgi:hypothetical protein
VTDASTIISTIVGSGGVLTAIGGTGRFIWNKIERRFELIEAQLRACQDREKASSSRAAIKLTAIELLWQEVTRLTPSSSNQTLNRVKRLLDKLKLPEPSPDLDALAREIDRRGTP